VSLDVILRICFIYRFGRFATAGDGTRIVVGMISDALGIECCSLRALVVCFNDNPRDTKLFLLSPRNYHVR
jgi:hypothetical protein